jgi:cytochrome c oxidase subunit 4
MSGHVVPLRVYLAVFAALLVLTAVTTAVAFVDLGRVNVAIMLAIAVTKATLVALYFMHVRWSSRLTWLVVCGGLVWLGLLVVITASDLLVRGLVPTDLSQLVHDPVEAIR